MSKCTWCIHMPWPLLHRFLISYIYQDTLACILVLWGYNSHRSWSLCVLYRGFRKSLFLIIKAAFIYIFTFTMDQMASMCNVRGVARSEETAKNDHLSLQFCSALRSILASFSQLFCFTAWSIIVLTVVSSLGKLLFSVMRPPVHHQTEDKVSE